MKRIILIFLIAFICLISTACDDKCVLPKPYVSGDPVLIQKLLTESVDTLSFGEAGRYFLEANCWRDFMPTTDECDYRGLLSSIHFKNNDVSIVSSDFSFQKQYVIYKDSVWIANVKIQGDNPEPGSFVTPDGPLWPVDSIVDVVLELKLQNVQHYVIKRNVIIRAVY
ncbi:MAG: hypothetical protein WCR42_12490 [bacterium]